MALVVNNVPGNNPIAMGTIPSAKFNVTKIPYNPNTYPGGYAQRSYTYNSPAGGTYQSPWSPEFVASLNPSYSAASGGGYGAYGIPSFSQFAGTSLNSLLNNIAQLKMQIQAPALAEQGRQFDVTSGLRGTELANALALGQGSLSNALTLGQGSLSNELALGRGSLSNQAQQIANALTLGQGELGLKGRAQTLTEKEYEDALQRQNTIQQWLMALLHQPGQNANAALYALTGYRP